MKRILDKWIASLHNKNDFLLRTHLNIFFVTLKDTHLFDVYQTVAGLLEICVDVVLLKS